jgi:hypothetical protein
MNILRQGNGAAKVQHGAHLFGKCACCQCVVEVLPAEVIYRPSAGNCVQCPHCSQLVPVKKLHEWPGKMQDEFLARVLGERGGREGRIKKVELRRKTKTTGGRDAGMATARSRGA